jgi:4-aminobutyrate aminotransferase
MPVSPWARFTSKKESNMSYLGPKTIIEKKKQFLLPCSYHFYQDPPQLVRGSMQYLYDHTGKQYLDCFAGVSVMNCGHSNPEILQTTLKQMETLQHTTTIYLTEPIVALGERLANYLPGNLTRSFFCMSGSEANEGALLLAKKATGRMGLIGLEGGLSGRTHLTMSLTGIPMWRTMDDPSPNTYLAEGYGKEPGETASAAMERSLASIRSILEAHPNGIAAVICEPIQGNGGIQVPHVRYFKRLKAILQEFGALLIIDEVQTGYGRTGKNFAIEHFDVVPDILTSAKALGNGVPIAAFSTTDEIAAGFTSPSASTLGGNPVSAANSLAVLDYLESHQLKERAANLGNLLLEKLTTLKESYPIISDVRGIGLMIGAELKNQDGSPATEAVDRILEHMKNAGFLIGKNGIHRNTLAFQPPLVVTKSDMLKMLDALASALQEERAE